jgi:solute carrier family 25 ornithine transporter 2/15
MSSSGDSASSPSESSSQSSSQSSASGGLRLRDTLSGVAGSVCLTYAGLPFEVIKLRLQTSSVLQASPAPAAAPAAPAADVGVRRRRKGVFGTGLDIVKNEGVTRLWRGVGPALASSLVENAVVFTANGFFTRFFEDLKRGERGPSPPSTSSSSSSSSSSPLSFAEHAMIGGLSGIFSATAICPAEVCKVRMQQQRVAGGAAYSSGWHCVAQIARTEGLAGLFSGLTPLLMRDVPFNTLFFGSYRVWTHLLTPFFPSKESRVEGEGAGALAFVSGGFAGMTAWTIVFPFDVVKSRMQVALPPKAQAQAAAAAVSSASKGVVPILRAILAEGGLPLLYRGWSAAVLRAFPANAALFWGVETADALLRKAGLP